MGGFAFCLGSASGASVVALDNKIEQAMVSASLCHYRHLTYL